MLGAVRWSWSTSMEFVSRRAVWRSGESCSLVLPLCGWTGGHRYSLTVELRGPQGSARFGSRDTMAVGVGGYPTFEAFSKPTIGLGCPSHRIGLHIASAAARPPVPIALASFVPTWHILPYWEDWRRVAPRSGFLTRPQPSRMFLGSVGQPGEREITSTRCASFTRSPTTRDPAELALI